MADEQEIQGGKRRRFFPNEISACSDPGMSPPLRSISVCLVPLLLAASGCYTTSRIPCEAYRSDVSLIPPGSDIQAVTSEGQVFRGSLVVEGSGALTFRTDGRPSRSISLSEVVYFEVKRFSLVGTLLIIVGTLSTLILLGLFWVASTGA